MASGTSYQRSPSFFLEHVQLTTNWEDVVCPICLNFPHNGVLLQCTSYDKGCRPFMCDTDHTHSNCLDRFKIANGLSPTAKVSSCSDVSSAESKKFMTINAGVCPACPLCRGEVTGWVIVDEVRRYLNRKRRCCEDEYCMYVGNYLELQKHVSLKHPNSRPSKIDSARRLNWEKFQQSSELIDVLSTIQSEVPHAVVIGDYVIEEYEFEDLPGDDRKRWISSVLRCVINKFRALRIRRKSRATETRRGNHHASSDSSNSDGSSMTSPDSAVYTIDEMIYVARGAASRENYNHGSFWRR